MSQISAGPGIPAIIGDEVFNELGLYLKRHKFSSLFILVDENSLKHCLPVLVSRVPRLLEAEIIELESGEKNKNIEVCAQVWRALSELGADRNSLLINLGGGVITDLGGFVASTFKRGIDFINIPTTLLAQVDAAIGGKTGIDLGVLKNEVGVFAEANGLFIWPGFLQTLNRRELASGIAEVLKHGLISDFTYWSTCRDMELTEVNDLDEVIRASVKIKSDIVAADPKESGERKRLNFGHTIGHAIESFFLEEGERTLLHGEAVAVGMICESWLSVQLFGLSETQLMEIRETIGRYFQPLDLNPMDDHRLVELMRHDKKNNKGEIRMALLKSIGLCGTGKIVAPEQIIEALNYYRSLS